ncbi:MAG: GNAT family N-acetyltransferase, partial [Actinomycetia bacterium]|nr:GNAT family N-acetyltransferase [Actinomycetes bacterium]
PGRLAGGDLAIALVEINGAPVAMAWLDLGLRFYGGTVGPLGTLFNVWTEPEYRRKGLARLAVEACLAHARERGVERVDLIATPMGVGLYARLGFVQNPHPSMRIELSDPPRPDPDAVRMAPRQTNSRS